jgi:2-succinyl-5-enolpyruvyl-6-hydroxy-3-cyclohexene-1-carboxylate synthase
MDNMTLQQWLQRAKRLEENAKTLRVDIQSRCSGVAGAHLLVTAAGDAWIGASETVREVERLLKQSEQAAIHRGDELPHFVKNAAGTFERATGKAVAS